jgi:hypothetical protein
MLLACMCLKREHGGCREEVDDGEAEDEGMKARLVQLLAGPETLKRRR